MKPRTEPQPQPQVNELRKVALYLFEERRVRVESYEMIPRQLRTFFTGTAIIVGGFCTLNAASYLTIRALRFVSEAKLKRIASPCAFCRGKGFYICKLCKGNANIEWSPLHDPIAINPCVCPTCEGNRVQRCLNCLGKGYD